MAARFLFCLLVCVFGVFAEANTSLDWFDFYDRKALSGYDNEGIRDIDEEECARRCLVGTSTLPFGSCLSFDYDHQYSKCVLSTANRDTPGATLADSNPPSRFDYYHRKAAYSPCDFETDLCQYTQDTSDDFDWTRDSGGTYTVYTGPTVDHTTGTSSGHYMYIETSFPQQRGDIARLISPSYRRYPDGQCLLFWAHMYGDHPGTDYDSVGTLTVSVKVGSTTTDIWSRSGNQGNQWFSVAVSIANSTVTSSYQVIFEGVRGNGIQGDIAIDDVSILERTCPDIVDCVPRQGRGLCAQICTNNAGSFSCSCNVGYTLHQDGRSCNDVDECVPNGGRGPCAQICTNTVGSFSCSCNVGYTLQQDGRSCNDVDECVPNGGRGPCDHTCANTDGSFSCSCNVGSTLHQDGLSCNVPTVPRDVRLTNLSWSELRVTWNGPDNFYGPSIGYVIDLYSSMSSDVVKSDINVAQNHTEYRFSGLEAATSYTVEVRANNGRNTGPPGRAKARTSDGFPSSPTNINRQEDHTYCNISWSSPVEPRGDIIGYNVHIQGHYPGEDGERLEGEYKVKSTASTSVRLMKSTKTEILYLWPNSVYIINVTGFTYTGEGNFSQTVNCTVPPGKTSKSEPPVLSDPTKIASTSFPLQLKPASERNGPIGCYHVVVVKSSSTENLPDLEMLQPYKTLEEARNSGSYYIAYIAMALPPDTVGDSITVTVGNGAVTSCNPQQAGRKRRALTSDDVYNQEYTNSPLDPDSAYTTSVRAYGPNDGEQPYFSASQYMEPVSTAADGEASTIPSHTFLAGMIGLGAVSALLLIALVASVVVNVVLKRRLASLKSKREATGTTVQNDAFDDTYYTDTRTNPANQDGTYCDVMDGRSTRRRGQADGTSQEGEYDVPDVSGEEGAYQTLDPRTLENSEYQNLRK